MRRFLIWRARYSVMKNSADVVVIGGGHAGCEAAAASARTGAETILVTHRYDTIGEMSWQTPQLAASARATWFPRSMLWTASWRGPSTPPGSSSGFSIGARGRAVRGPRAQADRQLYKAAIQTLLADQDQLSIVEGAVEDVLTTRDGAVRGIMMDSGRTITATAVVLTTGTFLRGMIFRGEERLPAGRIGDGPAIGSRPDA